MVSQYTVIELRRYTIKHGARATFARHFETWFPEAFQQLGAIAFGQFCERNQPDRFTWLRGFKDMNERLAVNQAFYFGPVWAEHKPAVNGQIADSDDVLLLCPARADSGVRAMCAVDPVTEPHGAQGIAVAQILAPSPTATLSGVTFSSMPAPTLSNAAAMATTTVGSVMTATFSDASKLDFKLAYQPFFITGDLVADGDGGKTLAGGYYDIYNQPIIDTMVAGKERQFFSDSPDGTSLLSVANAACHTQVAHQR